MENTEIIDHKKIRLPINYCLVKPDENYKYYHNDKGEETQILAGTSLKIDANPHSETDFSQVEAVETLSQNLSYSGTIVAMPEKLIFNGKQIKQLFEDNKDNMDSRMAVMKIGAKANEMKDDSVTHEVDIDIQIGDKVYYDYLEKFKVYDEGLVLNTDIGELFLIKYDKLELRIREGEIKPLNSWVFIDWNREQTLKFGNLELAGLDKRIEQTSGIKKSKIIAMSEPSRGHIDDPRFDDPIKYLQVGQEVMYQQHRASNLENDNHFVLFGGKEILKIQSKDILLVCEAQEKN